MYSYWSHRVSIYAIWSQKRYPDFSAVHGLNISRRRFVYDFVLTTSSLCLRHLSNIYNICASSSRNFDNMVSPLTPTSVFLANPRCSFWATASTSQQLHKAANHSGAASLFGSHQLLSAVHTKSSSYASHSQRLHS